MKYGDYSDSTTDIDVVWLNRWGWDPRELDTGVPSDALVRRRLRRPRPRLRQRRLRDQALDLLICALALAAPTLAVVAGLAIQSAR